MTLLLDDGNEYVGRHGALDLRLHGVLASAQNFFDPQMLLDPFEEQCLMRSPTAADVRSAKSKRTPFSISAFISAVVANRRMTLCGDVPSNAGASCSNADLAATVFSTIKSAAFAVTDSSIRTAKRMNFSIAMRMLLNADVEHKRRRIAP